jgi:hypothetical protein
LHGFSNPILNDEGSAMPGMRRRMGSSWHAGADCWRSFRLGNCCQKSINLAPGAAELR